ncbi:hypothetical protein FRC12_012203 [Ceratobasidium sp. 428]|nr:hypothetical protein FRC12_012203 [Ceratobasidium sp. 428]
MSNEPKQGVSLNSIVLAVLWQLGCVLTLGYAPKYNRRVQTWQAHDTTGNPTETSSNNGHCSPNCTLPHPELVKKSSARAKQQVNRFRSPMIVNLD